MRSEEILNGSKTAADYITGVASLPGQAQMHSFGRLKDVASQRPPPRMTVAAYRELRDAARGEELLDAERFGAVPRVIALNFGGEKWRTGEESWVNGWRHWGGHVVELDGDERVGDMPWVRSSDEVIYWRWLNTVITWMKVDAIRTNEGSLDCVAFALPFDRL